jgi:predicted DNA-binding protein
MRLEENKLSQRSRRVIVRLKLPMYEFLEEFSRNTKRTISDLVRDSLENNFMRLFLYRNPTTKELRKMFIETFADRNKRLKNLKKVRIRNNF